MDRDAPGAYRFGPMPSWFAHRQIAHDHDVSERHAEVAKVMGGEVRRDDAGAAHTSSSSLASTVSE